MTDLSFALRQSRVETIDLVLFFFSPLSCKTTPNYIATYLIQFQLIDPQPLIMMAPSFQTNR